jgi:WD40 repeat protein
MYFIGAREDRIDIWDYQPKQHQATLISDNGFDPSVYCLSSDGRMLAVADNDRKNVIVWDISIIDECREISQLCAAPSRGFYEFVYSVCFTSNNEQLIGRYREKVRLYDVRTKACVHVIAEEMLFIHSFLDKIILLSRDGLLQERDNTLTEIRRRDLGFKVERACITHSEDTIALATEGFIIVVDLATGELRKLVDGTWPFQHLQFSVDGSKLLASVGTSLKHLVLNVTSGAVLIEFDWNGLACFSVDASCIYGCSSLEKGIFCLDVATGLMIPSRFGCPVSLIGESYDNLSVFCTAEVILL